MAHSAEPAMCPFLEPAVLDELRRNRTLRPKKTYDAISRSIDVMVSLIGLVMISPVLLAVTIAIKAHDGGPVMYRQKRLGWRGSGFSIFKFRSMVVDAESKGAKLRSSRDDPRITPVGKFLREFHLDELPQLINVLRGEMSLVGPRPALMFHKDYYDDWELPRLAVRPGITGLSQVNGGNAMNWDERIAVDIYFVRNRNLAMYVEILWKTFSQLFVRKGIYGRDGQVKGWTRPVPEWYHDDTM